MYQQDEGRLGAHLARTSRWPRHLRMRLSASTRLGKPTKDGGLTVHLCETASGGIATYLGMFEDTQPANRRSLYVLPREHQELIGRNHRCETFTGGRDLRGLFAFVVTAMRAVSRHKPDAVFCHSSFSLLALVLLRLVGYRGRIIYCPHGWAIARFGDVTTRRAKVVRAIESNLSRLADTVINISRYEHNLVARLGYRGHHALIENAVAKPIACDGSTAAMPQQQINLLFVGRFDKQKGVDLLLEAFAEVRKVRSDLSLTLIGAGVLGDLDVAVPEGVTMKGWVSRAQIDAYYRSADALIVPSRWEGFGLVVPEALRNGTPALVSDRGALGDLVEEGVTGHVFALENICDMLINLDHATLRAMRPACAAAYETRFRPDRWSADIHGLFAPRVPA